MSTCAPSYVPHGINDVPDLRSSNVSVKRTRRPIDKATARALINGFYTELYGTQIRYESARTMRLKIQEIEEQLVRYSGTIAYSQLVRECVAYERVCELLEILD